MNFIKKLWLVYLFPGSAIVWVAFHFPGKGNLMRSARNKKSVPYKFFESTLFWVIVLPILYFLGVELVQMGLQEVGLMEAVPK